MLEYSLTILAAVIAALSFKKHRLFCWIIASNFIICALLNLFLDISGLMAIADPWYFFIYSIVDVVYVYILCEYVITRQSKTACWVFFFSLFYNNLVFIEYYNESSALYAFRPYYMTGICITFLIIMAGCGRLRAIYGLFDNSAFWNGRRRNMSSINSHTTSSETLGANE